MKQIFDEIRLTWVAATPEEMARQLWVQKMVKELGYPKSLISIEKEVPPLKRRADIICYTKEGKPLLLLEGKAGRLTQEAMGQALGYNQHLKAPYVALFNAQGVLFHDTLAETTLYQLPPYQELIHGCRLSS